METSESNRTTSTDGTEQRILHIGPDLASARLTEPFRNPVWRLSLPAATLPFALAIQATLRPIWIVVPSTR